MVKVKQQVTCPYCKSATEFLQNSKAIYHGRNFGPVYLCRPCQAWVGCHPRSWLPLGRLANAELRKWKQKAHKAFDPLWQQQAARKQWPKGRARRVAYSWLSEKLNLQKGECHIGLFDIDLCRQVVEVCADPSDYFTE